MLEKDILDSLDDLGYQNDSFTTEQFGNKLFAATLTSEYADLVHWLATELRHCCKLEEHVNKVSSTNDFNSFLLELSSFLKEINCPYSCLTDGPFNERLSTKENRLLLLNFLCTEVQAGRMTFMNNAQTSKAQPSANTMQIAESETASSLRQMLMALGFPKPPANITSQQLFAKVLDKVKEQSTKVPKDHLGNPLFTGVLIETQWETLAIINDSMNQEYKGRKDMLLKRLDVTVQSFTWSDRLKKKEDDLHKIYQPIRQSLKSASRVSFVDLLAARSDLLTVDITSGKHVREKTKSKINKVLMHGKVPDRGGRPSEIEPPPPEMPPWQQRSGGGYGRGSGGGPQAPRQGGRGGGGGRVQSGWSSTGGREAAQSWGGGYEQQAYGHGGQYNQGIGGGYHGNVAGGFGQQGAAYYQDYYNTGQQQGGYQQGDSYHKRGGGGGRGGRGGRGGGGHNYR